MIHKVRRWALQLPPPLKNLFKQIDLNGRIITAGWRTLPTFLIIGAQKSGTTSLYEYIVQHPAVIPARTKEINYFDSANYQQGVRWYQAQFPLYVQQQLMRFVWPRHFHTGEATTYYLFHPDVPKRVYETTPNAKLIAILRNPVDRAFSHYYHEWRKGRESLSFEDALACEEERLAAVAKQTDQFDTPVYRQWSYKAGGLYAEQLSRWLACFPREQLLILPSEEMFADPTHFLATVFDFLELPSWTIHGLRPFNTGQYQSEIRLDTRQQLETYFAPHNQALAELTGVSLPW